MEDEIKIWTIKSDNSDEIINEIKNYSNNIMSTRLLNLDQEEFDILEKYIYDIAVFHFKRLNIDISNDYYVEFWCKDKFQTHVLHVDCDEVEKLNSNYIYPLISCVTYFNNNNYPTIITDIEHEDYLFKDFEHKKRIFFSFPEKYKQITFNGKYYHGSSKLSEFSDNEDRFIIAINLWNKKPTSIEYYTSFNKINKYQKEQLIEITLNEKELQKIYLPDNIKQYNLLNDILYNKYEYAFDFLKKDINIENSKDNKNIILLYKKYILNNKNIKNDIVLDIEFIKNNTFTLNRFYQRFIIKNFYNEICCNWIISEAENFASKNGWTTTRHINYPTTDIPVEKIPKIFTFILESTKNLCNEIEKYYNLSTDIRFNIIDLFIVKYDINKQNYLDIHTDGSFFTFNIALNDSKDYEGGGTYFEDGLITKLEKGDVLIHSGKIKHGGIEITKGVRYLLVGFLDIKV